ncbi:MAG: hypothetical protein HC836_26765 [Richelia sp. RM2_1_2]|nr:hypothetical protein [Richelia sp. RM2_1_2]
MPRRHPKFLNLDGYVKYPQSFPSSRFRKSIQHGASLYQQFNQFEASHILRVNHPRLIPPVVVELVLDHISYEGLRCLLVGWVKRSATQHQRWASLRSAQPTILH